MFSLMWVSTMTDLHYENCVLPADYTVPEGTRKLSFYRVTFAAWPALPVGLRSLEVDSCLVEAGGIMDFGAAGPTLEVLKVGFQTFLPVAFPPELKKLGMRKLHFDEGFPALPSTLEELRMIRIYAPQASWDVLRWPAGLWSIFLSSVGMEVLPPMWPPALRKLFIEEMFIASMPPVPEYVGAWQGGDVDFV